MPRLPVADTPDFQKKQYAFAAHIRDPENNPAPTGIEDRRMGVYRELFFNNLLNLLRRLATPHVSPFHKLMIDAVWNFLT